MAVAGMMLLPCIVSMQHGGGVALPCQGLLRMVADVYAACISGNHSACAWQHASCFCKRLAVVPPCRCLEMRAMLANCLARLAPFCLPLCAASACGPIAKGGMPTARQFG